MNYLKRIIGLVFMINSFTSYGQQEPELPNMIPMSPEAASLGKYIETEVSLQSGIPNISIPLYTIEQKGTKLPIGLSYHAGGIKVEEVASNVGLGWTLNTGGMISRVVRGLPDDTGNGFIHTSNTVDVFEGLETNYNTGQRLYQLLQASLGHRDYEADIFIFNFPGYSGKFQYNQQTDSFIQLPHSNIVIEPVYENSKVITWILIDPNGIKYYFGKSKDGLRNSTETSHSVPILVKDGLHILGEGGTPSYTESWKLMDIVFPNTDQEIQYVYYPAYNYVDFSRLNESKTKAIPGSFNSHAINYVRKNYYTSMIKEINFSQGKVVFKNQTEGRQDLMGGIALDKIEIYDKEDNFIKGFRFEYDYFYSPSSDGIILGEGFDEVRRYRLRLDALYEIASDNEEQKPYLFTYNETPLPSRFSYSQDFWGFYNGKNNQTLVPKTGLFSTSYGGYVYFGQANRSIDLLKSKAGTLEKIKHPLGGETRYYMESNTVSNYYFEGGYPYYAGIMETALEEFANSEYYEVNNPNYHYATTFTIPSSVRGPVRVLVNLMSGCENCCSNIDCDYRLTIWDDNDNVISHINQQENIEVLEPGTYKITAEYTGDESPEEGDFYTTVEWDYEVHPNGNTDNSYYGGLRINKIVYDDNNGNSLTRRYQYYSFGTLTSSGYAISAPAFLDTDLVCGTAPLYRISSNSNQPFIQSQGNYVGYPNVTEYDSEDRALGKTEYTFTSVGDYAHVCREEWPSSYSVPILDTNWLRGNLIDKKEYEFKDGGFVLKRHIENSYEKEGSYSVCFAGVSSMLSDVCSENVFKFGLYSLYNEWYRLKTTITKEYFEGTNYIESTSTQYYNSNPLLPSKTEVSYYGTGSSAKKVESLYQYPFDLLSDNHMQDLVDDNRIATPIVVTKKVNGTAVKTVKTIYKNNSSTGNRALPGTIQTHKGNGNNLESRIHYDRYDSHGNLIQVAMAGGTKISYIWGYDRQYPVAKIEGAPYGAITPSLIIAIQTASDSGNETNMLDALQDLRDELADDEVMVTTYTYKPLIGMTSQTDPKGYTITYHYDNFGRLEYIKDADNNIIEEYNYHYKN